MATHISPVVLRQEVGRRIRLARQHTGLTVVEAAARLEITRSALSRFENGIGRVDAHLLKSMMDVYDQRMDDVLDMIRQARAPGWWKQYGISDKDFIAPRPRPARSAPMRSRWCPASCKRPTTPNRSSTPAGSRAGRSGSSTSSPCG